MDRIVSYLQLQGLIADIRKLGNGFVTNFFWDETKHAYWIKDSKLVFETFGNCYLLLHDCDTFYNLFYIATDIDTVANSIKQLKLEKDVVVDLVIKGDEQGELHALSHVGFVPYRELFRMSHIGQLAHDDWSTDNSVTMACEADACLIHQSIHADFDPRSEQLPSLQEIMKYIEKQSVLVVKDGSQLCGYIIFELMGKTTWYLRYWHTSPRYRNQGIGGKLLKAALVQGKSTKRQQLWVIADNDNAILRYEHYGFKREDFHNYVLIKRQ